MLKFDGQKNLGRRKTLETEGKEQGYFPVTYVFKAYQKKSLTYAVKISEPFEVDTLEGLHSAKAGDYLAVGIHGELYPIDAAVFEETYEEVGK